MHNMIVENKQRLEVECIYNRPLQYRYIQREFTYYKLEAWIKEIEDVDAYFALCNDLIHHLW